jgi:hypothetical protein
LPVVEMAKGLVVYAVKLPEVGEKLPTTVLSICTLKDCCPPPFVRLADWKEMVKLPVDGKLIVWLIDPLTPLAPCRKAVWVPSGALAAPQTLPLAWMPLLPEKVQLPPVGLY